VARFIRCKENIKAVDWQKLLAIAVGQIGSLAKQPDVKETAYQAIDRLKPEFIEKYIDDLDINPDWEWIKPTARDRVAELLKV